MASIYVQLAKIKVFMAKVSMSKSPNSAIAISHQNGLIDNVTMTNARVTNSQVDRPPPQLLVFFYFVIT